jgi:hypothetical protein
VDPEERRHPKVTIQDLRRDLREADEDRYRLVVRSADERRPRVTVQQLRRDLREADADRFGLRMRLRSVRKASGVGLLFCFAAGAALGMWSAFRQATPPDRNSLGSLPPRLNSLEFAPIVTPVVATDSQVSEGQAAMPASDIATNDGATRTGTRSRSARKRGLQSPPAPTREVYRPAAPRPLHPGEFGRKKAI